MGVGCRWATNKVAALFIRGRQGVLHMGTQLPVWYFSPDLGLMSCRYD